MHILDLYLKYQNTEYVGQVMNLSGRTIRARLKRMGVTLRPSGTSNLTVQDLNSPTKLAAIRHCLRSTPVVVSRHRRVSATDYLETLDLYIKYQSTTLVGPELNLVPTTIVYRLHKLGVRMRHGGVGATVEELNGVEFLSQLRRRLQQEAGQEGPGPKPWSTRPYSADPLTAAERLQTLELYIELQNARVVGLRIGISGSAVAARIRRLGLNIGSRGRGQPMRFEDANDSTAIEKVLLQLRAQAHQEQALVS
jgi:hypothetical protein